MLGGKPIIYRVSGGFGGVADLAGASAAPARRPVIALVGPTGVGKSRWALQLAAELPVEIVSVDSAQVYVGLDIGSAKPTDDEQRRSLEWMHTEPRSTCQ